jgi:predicted Zn-dependent peptidase
LDRVRKNIHTSFDNAIENPQFLFENFVREMQTGRTLKENFKKIDGTTKEDVREVIKKYLINRPYQAMILRPQN